MSHSVHIVERLYIFLCFVVAQNHLSGQGGLYSFFSPAKTSYIWLKTVLHRPSNMENTSPPNFNPKYLACHCHISNFKSDFFLQERSFIIPCPPRHPIAKNQRNSFTNLVHRSHLISTTSPGCSSFPDTLPSRVLITTTLLNCTE